MAELLDLKDMEKKYPSNVNFSKDEIKQIVSDLKRQDWITLPKHRAGRDGGTGNYIEEDVFGVKENNEERPDLGIYELKTHREHSDSLSSLKAIEPGPKKKSALITPLVRDFGWPTQPQCPFRIRKDSIIWISIRAPLGIELFRAAMTPDSIYFMNIFISELRIMILNWHRVFY